jgi:hypothetical protein
MEGSAREEAGEVNVSSKVNNSKNLIFFLKLKRDQSSSSDKLSEEGSEMGTTSVRVLSRILSTLSLLRFSSNSKKSNLRNFLLGSKKSTFIGKKNKKGFKKFNEALLVLKKNFVQSVKNKIALKKK